MTEGYRKKLKFFMTILFIVCVSLNVSYPQKEKAANIIFELNLSKFYPTFYRQMIEIEIIDKYSPDKDLMKLRIFYGVDRDFFWEPNEKPMKPIILDLKRKYFFSAIFGKILKLTGVSYFPFPLFLKVSIENWKTNSGYLAASKDKLILGNLYLPPSEYHITIKLHDYYLEESQILIDEDKKVFAGQSYPIKIEKHSIFGKLIKKIATRDSLFLSIIVGLIGIIVGVLKDKFKKAIEWVLDELGKFGIGKLAERRFLKRFLENVIFNHKYLRLIGYNTAGISRPLLEEVFVSLRVSTQDSSNPASVGLSNDNEIKEIPAIPFSEALRQYKNLTILGGPGAGKTTTLRYALLMFARKQANVEFGMEEDLLPIFIPLRRLSNNANSIFDDINDVNSGIISKEVLKECPKNYFEKRLKKGKCIILLDGLDEVTDEKIHRQVAQKINNMAADYPKNRFIVTCRIAGWKNLLSGFKILETQDFSRSEIQRFIRGWHRAIITQQERNRLELDFPDKQEFQKKWKVHNEEKVKPAIDIQSRRLIDAIDSNSRILAIAVNPMLLSLISLVHYNRSILPKGRTILYHQCIEFLIDSWDRTRDITSIVEISAQQKESMLREIAFSFQIEGKGEEKREKIIDIIKEKAPGIGIGIPAEKLLEDIEDRSGLLVERSIGVLGFSHLTLQEYLVAKHIQLNPNEYYLIKKNLDKQEWREVILLYTGLLDDASALIKHIMEFKAADRLILAGYCLGDAQKIEPTIAKDIVDKLLSELKANKERTEELINALAAIASDFKGEAKTVGEILSQLLINTLETDNNATNRINAITILGKARITLALPVLVDLIKKPGNIRSAAVAALISFGNLALECIRKYAEKAQSDDIEPLVNILSGIDTSSSAKLLIKLYDLISEQDDTIVSIALTQMLRNPFIYDDLMVIDKTDLPGKLTKLNLNDHGWPYEDLPSKAPFRFLDVKLREDVSGYLKNIASNEKSGKQLNYSTTKSFFERMSFKILFPSLLVHIRNFKDKLPSIEFFTRLGFDTIQDGYKKIQFLLGRIQRYPASDLNYIRDVKSSSFSQDQDNYTEKKSQKILIGIANVYFVLFYFWNFIIYNIIFLSLNYFSPYYKSFGISEFAILFSFLSLFFHLFLIIFTKIKLKRKFFSEKIFGTIFCPYANFFKIFPYTAKRYIWIKWVLFMFILLILSVFSGFFIDTLIMGRKVPFDVLFLIWLLPDMIFIFLSFVYLKISVLKVNPIYQLLLLHTAGRVEVLKNRGLKSN